MKELRLQKYLSEQGIMSRRAAEDEIKKGQQTLIKRIIAAAIVFFVFAAILSQIP